MRRPHDKQPRAWRRLAPQPSHTQSGGPTIAPKTVPVALGSLAVGAGQTGAGPPATPASGAESRPIPLKLRRRRFALANAIAAANSTCIPWNTWEIRSPDLREAAAVGATGQGRVILEHQPLPGRQVDYGFGLVGHELIDRPSRTGTRR